MKLYVVPMLLLLAAVPAGAACIDAKGVPVVEMASYRIKDVAQAGRLPDGRPVIYYNPDVLKFLSQPSRTFFEYHECAHHLLGHPLDGVTQEDEQAADCWAVRTLVRDNILDLADVKTIQRDFKAFARQDETHQKGSQRSIELERCLQRTEEIPAAPVAPAAQRANSVQTATKP